MGEAEEKALNWNADKAEEIGSKWGKYRRLKRAAPVS
jgi:hypothetical protein